MSNTYRIHGTRYLRKYTAAEKSSIYAYMSDVRKIASSLCTVPWERVGRDIAATTTIHTEEGLDWNAPERDRFDAAEWCGEHSDGFHRAFAQAACYVFKLPDSAIGTSIEKLGIQVTSDPYNPYGARISAMTSNTLDIPMDCATVREGEVYRAPDDDGMGAAPRLFMRNADGTQNWYANTEKVVLEPETPLTAKQYLLVFCCLENYNRARDGWIEGSSYIDNDVELTLSASCEDLNDGELNDLSVTAKVHEFNVVRGECVPRLVGEVSGVQVAEVVADGSDRSDGGMPVAMEPEKSCIGLRTVYAKLYSGQMEQLGADEYGLSNGPRPGASFSVSLRDPSGHQVQAGYSRLYSEYLMGSINCIAYGNGVLVAGRHCIYPAERSGLVYSTDGGVSFNESSAPSCKFIDVAFGDGIFVAVAEEDKGIFRSTDNGVTWVQTEQASGRFVRVAFGNGVFVAANIIGIYYSTDNGETWSITEHDNLYPNSIAFGNGVFVICCDDVIMRSTDGISWSEIGRQPGYMSLFEVAFGNGVFVAGGASGIWYSNDNGDTWTQSAITSGSYYSIAFGNGIFVSYGELSGSKKIVKSEDGISWEATGANNSRYLIEFCNDRFLSFSDKLEILSSQDGVTWTKTTEYSGRWLSLASGNGKVVAGNCGLGLWYSEDFGKTWARSGKTGGVWRSLAFGNGIFAAGSYKLGIWISSDGGATWTQSGQTSGEFLSLAFGDGTFVAGSEGDGLFRSADGETWTQSGKSTGKFLSLAFGDGIFVAGSYGQGLWRSEDGGSTWVQSGQTTGSFVSLTFSNETFFAGSDSSLLESKDGGLTWDAIDTGVSFDALDGSDGTVYAIVNGSEVRQYHPDGGKLWYPIDDMLDEVITRIVHVNGSLIAACHDNTYSRLVTISQCLPLVQSDFVSDPIGDSITAPPVAFGDGVFVACRSGEGIWFSTDDCATWTQSGKTDGSFASLAFGNGIFVAGSGRDGGIWYSTDSGRTWSQSGKTTGRINSLAFGNGIFVAATIGEGVVYSTDNGETWSQSGLTANSFWTVAYGNGAFVSAMNTTPGIYMSTDGATWALSQNTPGESFISSAFGNGTFVVGGFAGSIMYSIDSGETWKESLRDAGYVGGVAFGNGVFVASTSSKGIVLSHDSGRTWTRIGSIYDKINSSIAFGNGVFFVFGNRSAIVLSSFLLRITSSVIFLGFSVPYDFRANRIRLDWSGWEGYSTPGGKFNVWLKRGEFASSYTDDLVKNHLIYDARSSLVDGYELVGTIDARDPGKTATLDLTSPLEGTVATILLTSFVSTDNVNPGAGMTTPIGVAPRLDVDLSGKQVLNVDSSWRPDITLLG